MNLETSEIILKDLKLQHGRKQGATETGQFDEDPHDLYSQLWYDPTTKGFFGEFFMTVLHCNFSNHKLIESVS